MIKKMLAMLVAISCAFGAWADTHISGTDFTGLTAGPFALGLDDEGQASNSTFWYNGDESDFEGTIIDGGSANYLDFESNITNPLYRTINDSYGLAPSSFQATPIGTGLFIDTHVQFTPYLVNENHPAPSKLANDDKLIVWVRETEVDGDANITNLIITAGYIAGNGNVSASNYVASLSSAAVSALCDGQHRLTIKSYQNITAHSGVTVMGFVVYVDETVVEYIGDAFADGSVFLPLVPGPAQYYSQGGGHNKLLPCLMDYGTDPSAIDSYSKLTAVGYAGMGKIGDVIFDSYNTTYPAFAGDDLAFQVVLGDGVTSFDYLGDTYTTNASFTVDATATSVTISNVLYDTTAGYTHKTGTWHNNVAVDNQVGAGGDYGTFYFANGTILTLVGFQANYIVNGTEYDNLTDALAAALAGGYTLVLNNDVQITEGDGSLTIGENKTLVLDLKGHTIKGTGGNETPTIMNMGGTLTIIDTSANHDGKVLNCDAAGFCLVSFTGSTTTLDAGIYEEVDDFGGDLTTITINGGTYRDNVYGPSSFYLSSCIATGKQIVEWITDGDDNYAVIGEPSGDTWDITFSTNNVVVTEWNLTVNDGSPIGNHIPNFTGGSWDAPAPTAETVVNSDTNFNYTIETSYTLTYATEYGAVPDGVVYTASTPDFALAAAPVTEVVGIEFAGWVIGSVTNAAGATYVVADHLENTTATAAWAPVVPTGTAIYLVMGSGVDSISTSFNGTDWTAYTDPLQDVELGSTLYIKGTSSVTGYDVPQFSIVVDDTHATEQTALVVNKSAIVYFPQTDIDPSSPYAGRDGTPALPFVIRNYADLVALKNGVANGTVTNQCFEQVADINMDGEDPWTGIGTFETVTAGAGAFEGTYDGGNHTIANVTFDQHEYNGIFASVVGGVIKNLTVDVDGFAATSAFGGAAIAGVAESCHLTNLVATGTIIGQNNTPCTHSAAGIAVRMQGTVAYACTNRCEIWSSKGKLGGIAAIGQPANAVAGHDYLTLCSNEGDIHNTKASLADTEGVGGLFGYLGYHNNGQKQHITFTDCRSVGTVYSAASSNTGSFSGKTADLNEGAIVLSGTNVTLGDMRVIYNSDANGSVTYGKSIGGGLVELCTQAAFETNNTYSTLWSDLTPTFAFEAAGTISFNTNLFAATAFAITATGDLDVDSTEAGGIVTFTASVPTPTDPWAPSAETDEAAAAKAAELFPGTEVAENVDTLAEYEALVTYIKSVTSQSEVPTDLTTNEKTYMWKSFILGANPLFDEEPAVEITSLTAGDTAGLWDFTVKVTEGESTDAYNVAADKVGALVKIRSSLTSGTWVAPTAGNIEAVKLLGGNLIKVEVNFGDGTSGFMKVSEE